MRYSLGDTVRLYLDIFDSNAGVISQSPKCAIQRISDGKWLQSSDGSWQTSIVENDMTQLDSVKLPGRYYFDFDQELDTETGSTAYIARLTNTAPYLRIEYQDLEFGPLAAAAAINLCSVQGVIYTAQGEPQPNVLVRATLVPVFSDAVGRAIVADAVVGTHTNELGEFDLQLVRGGVFRLEISAVGYDRKITVPDQASVLFTDL